jgi:hypothetical protein
MVRLNPTSNLVVISGDYAVFKIFRTVCLSKANVIYLEHNFVIPTLRFNKTNGLLNKFNPLTSHNVHLKVSFNLNLRRFSDISHQNSIAFFVSPI